MYLELAKKISRWWFVGFLALCVLLGVTLFIDLWAFVIFYGQYDEGDPRIMVNYGWGRYIFALLKWYTVPAWGILWLLWKPVI